MGTETIKIYKKIVGDEHPEYAISLSYLSDYYAQSGNYNEAIKMSTEVKNIFKKIYGEEHYYYATSLSYLAYHYSLAGNIIKAIELGKESIRLDKIIIGDNNPSYANALSNLAGYYDLLGDSEEAIRIETEAMEIRRNLLGEKHIDYSKSLGTLALCYFHLGNYGEAIRLGTQAMEIRKEILGKDHPSYAKALNNLAQYYGEIGNYSEAIRLGTEALAIDKKTLGEEHPDYATDLDNLAGYYHSLENYEEAIQLASDAVAIYKKALGEVHPDYAIFLSNLAKHFEAIGNYSEAIRLETEAVELIQQVFGKKHPNYSRFLGSLGMHYYMLGNYEKAITLCSESIDVGKKSLGELHPSYAYLLGLLAVSHMSLNQYDEALKAIRNDLEITTKHLQTQFYTLSYNERKSYWDKKEYEYCHLYPWLLSKSSNPSYIGDLYDKSALFAKGLLLNTSNELSLFLENTGDSTIIRNLKELQKINLMLNRLYEKPITERPLDTDSLEYEAEKLEKDLMQRSKTYGDYTRNLCLTWQEVQKALNEDDAAVEFLSYFDRDANDIVYCALILKKESDSPELIKLFNQNQFWNMAQDSSLALSETKLVWEPLFSKLNEVKNIYFSPSGILHQIPIEYSALNDGSIMSDHYNMYRMSSTRQLVTGNKNAKMITAAIYGGLDYDASSKELLAANQGIKVPPSIRFNSNLTAKRSLEESSLRAGCVPLEGTRREAEFISKELKSAGITAKVYKDSQGTEESFKTLSGNCPSLLHIGTHGFYWTPDEAELRKQMSDNMKFLGADDKRVHAEDKALSRSGLMMAGCNRVFNNETLPDSLDDGILTAKEISQMDLRGLNLVVLSACETALGDISGSEGVFGLQRAFKKAGAQAIMMSLWKVDDVATENMMKFFYTHLTKGESIRQSFVAAQQELRAIDPDPRHWAAFILMDALD